MNDHSANEKKLVQAFKTFFEKSISPFIANNDGVMNEWKYFSKLISADPIDYNQIQFYILLANKSQYSPSQNSNNENRQITSGHEMKANLQQTPPVQKSLGESNNSDIRGSNSRSVNTPKKNNLISSIENFQALLMKNQQKLQNFSRKDISGQAYGSNNSKRYY